MIYVLADGMTLSHALNYTSSKEGGIDSNGCCGSAKVQHSTFVKIPVIICSICISNSANRAKKVRVHMRLFETFRDFDTRNLYYVRDFETTKYVGASAPTAPASLPPLCICNGE